MALSDEQKQAIRDEEFFRAELRKELAGSGQPRSTWARLSAFFDSKVGFWLLTTVLVGAGATAFTAVQQRLNREATERRETAERALRDAETLLKLAPMLTSDKLAEVKIAVVLLNGLVSDAAVDRRVSTQVIALIDETVQAGTQQNATAQEQASATAILAYADKPRIEAIQGASPSSETQTVPTMVAAIDNPSLPVRVYIQIGQSDDSRIGEAARDKLRGAGLVVPGIERVRNSPKQDSIRYCADKVAPEAVERVGSVAASLSPRPPVMTVLDPKLCGNVRFNHFELWFARRSN